MPSGKTNRIPVEGGDPAEHLEPLFARQLTRIQHVDGNGIGKRGGDGAFFGIVGSDQPKIGGQAVADALPFEIDEAAVQRGGEMPRQSPIEQVDSIHVDDAAMSATQNAASCLRLAGRERALEVQATE